MFKVMESERENKRKRGSGRFRNENKTRKDLGKSCVTHKGLQNPANVPLTLNELTCEVKAATVSSDNAKVKLQLHHRKAEAASQKMREDIANLQLPGSSVTCLVMDLEQVSHVLL
ncbi:hypothetical protein MML48_6g00012560 [Holotrichia oblita]|uniref:Uncharacterized protein n=1 Tax=Holotrichia oblita TaxID=644536 RepID=A0ACB9SY40_HOLOL|nr:hypothetical protein MML48_6g00012560 [Holotrichia oblita]